MNRGLSASEREQATERLRGELAAAGLRDPEGLALEAVAVLDGLLAADREGATEVDTNEAMALGALLGRRLSSVGVTATSALLLVERIVEARRALGGRDAGVGLLRAVVLEGFAAGLRERTLAEIEERIAAQVAVLTLAPGLVLVPLPYLEDVDRMGAAIDAVGRVLLARDVKACVLWAHGPVAHREEASLAGVAALVENARMIGAKVAIASSDAVLRGKIAERLDRLVPVEAELGPALELLGYSLKEHGSALKRWLSR